MGGVCFGRVAGSPNWLNIGGDIEKCQKVPFGSKANVEVTAGLPLFVADAGFDTAVGEAHLVGGLLV